MPKGKKAGCLGCGCALPVFIILIVVVVGGLIIGLMAGPIGKGLFGDLGLPEWFNVPRPHPELPAEPVFHLFGAPITNAVITGWLSVIVLVVLSLIVTRRIKLIPGRLQSAMESVMAYLLNFCTEVAGEKNGRRFFPLVATIFLFVITNAWTSLIPGWGTILISVGGEEPVHLLRGANTDINLPLALAMVSFVMVGYYGIKEHKLKFVEEYIRFRALRKGPMGIIDVFVGFLELLSVFIRILSFTFRLFGNMTAGEILILMIMFLVPWVAAVPFYGLELLVGYIQALIFAGLTLVFLTVATAHHEAE